MELRWTVIDPQRTGARVEVAITAPAGTLMSAVAGQLGQLLGADGPSARARFRCNGIQIGGSDLLGLPPLLQGAVLTLGAGPGGNEEPPRPADEADLLQAHVIAGPDAGSVFPLPVGRHQIGRAAGNSIQICDPDVSRAHAELIVGDDQVEVRERGSRNGTWVGDQQIDQRSRPFNADDVLRLGSSRLVLRTPDRPPAAITVTGEGRLRVNRGPQLRPVRAIEQIHFPAAPAKRPVGRFPWPMMLLPLLLAVPMAILFRQPGFALFAVMTPILMAGQYLTDRRSAGRDGSRRARLHRAAEARSQAALDLAVAADAAHLEASRPDLARLVVTAEIPTDELWCRSESSAEFLVLRLGRGAEPAAVVVHRPAPNPAEEPAVAPQHFIHADVPVAVNLSELRVLGICGPRSNALGLVRSLIGQVCVLHSPAEVQVEVLIAEPADRTDWLWLPALPHFRTPTANPPEGTHRAGRARVVILDGAETLRCRSSVAADLGHARHSPAANDATLLICLDRTEQQLPTECRGTVILDPPVTPHSPHSAVMRADQAMPVRFTPDLGSERWAERISHRLAPLIDATPDQHSLPSSVQLLDLLLEEEHVRPFDPADLARHWRRQPAPAPAAILGLSARGPFRIDLRRDGPHLLIGGTTGAGKSELLQTLVVSLAVGAGPDAVSFLLIDYKGGAAFRDCARLPHVGGVITDLDPDLAQRALTSLTAELRRRERQLNAIGAVDIDAYVAARGRRQELPAMARLVVIVDEFRVLAEELPQFVSGLIRMATVGRSLGVHLVLATQRPAGIVSAEIVANVNLRISLRVRDGADSRDLIDDQAAASIPAELPGRAFARGGAGPLIAFQTARVSGVGSESRDDQPRVRRLCSDGAGWTVDPSEPASCGRPGSAAKASAAEVSAGQATGGEAAGGLALIATAARAAASTLNLAPVCPPWLPPLPNHVGLGEVLQRVERTKAVLPFGLIDLPEEQRQEPACWQLRGSHLAVVGGPRSGRTTALRTLVRAAVIVPAAMAGQSTERHLYLIDGAGALAGLRGLAHVEAVVPVHDLERSERLLRRLGQEIGRRQGNATSSNSTCGSPTSGEGEACDVVVVIDGWEALTSAWNDVDHGQLVDRLISVLRDGPAVGISAVISGGRSLLTGTASSLLADRVVLRFADPADAVLAGVPSSRTARTGPQPAGRGVFISPDRPAGAEIQVAVSADTHPPRAPGDPTSMRGPEGRPGWRLPALPQRLEYHELLTAAESRQHQREAAGPKQRPSRGVLIGIGGDDVVPLALDLESTTVALVLGPSGSGRSNTLKCIAAGLVRSGETVVALAAIDDGWPGDVIVIGRQADTASRLSTLLARYPAARVLIDEAQPGDPGTDPSTDLIPGLLTAHLAPRPRQPCGRLVLAGSVTDLLTAYRGVLTLGRAARSGLLLGRPRPGDGEIFGLDLGRRPPGPPGRALLIQNSQVTTIQLATWRFDGDSAGDSAGDSDRDSAGLAGHGGISAVPFGPSDDRMQA